VSAASDRLRARRAALLARAEAQREALRGQAGPIVTFVDSADRGIARVRRLATPPVLLAAGVAAAALLHGGRGRRLVAAGLTLTGLALRLRSLGQVFLAADRRQPVSRSR